jgi:hypothetical protein
VERAGDGELADAGLLRWIGDEFVDRLDGTCGHDLALGVAVGGDEAEPGEPVENVAFLAT